MESRSVIDRAARDGGERNGGVIDPRIVWVRDSLVSMGFVLNLLAERAATCGGLAAIAGNGRLNDIDGVRIDWPEGWVHLRASNTEPIARVIAEAADAATAESLVKRAMECQY